MTGQRVIHTGYEQFAPIAVYVVSPTYVCLIAISVLVLFGSNEYKSFPRLDCPTFELLRYTDYS